MIMPQIQSMKRLLAAGSSAGLLVVALLSLQPVTAQASVTNAVWTIETKGGLAIQRFDQQVIPRVRSGSFKTKTFINMVLDRPGTTVERLALNMDMAGGVTNFYLSIWDTSTRQIGFRLTTNETTTLISDGDNLVFTTDAALIPNRPANWGGGYVRIAGSGRFVNGVPAKIKASLEGIFIDTRPGDLSGTTGIVTRAKISMTPGSPLRILPPQPQN